MGRANEMFVLFLSFATERDWYGKPHFRKRKKTKNQLSDCQKKGTEKAEIFQIS
jgi:hypothetical protein